MRSLIVTSPKFMRGKDVEQAQTLLAHNRFRDFDPGAVDGEWGQLCEAATRRAQYWLGRKKDRIDGVFREGLMAQLAGAKRLSLTQRARRKARLLKRRRRVTTIGGLAYAEAARYVGTHESPYGSNNVLFSRWYMGSDGRSWSTRSPGPPWCAMFVSWCLTKAGFERDRSVNWAYCPSILAAARDRRAYLSLVATPRRGDIVLYDWDRDGVADHIGFVDGNSSDGGWRTIEGNTSATDNSNGGEVQRRIRYRSDIVAFVRATRH